MHKDLVYVAHAEHCGGVITLQLLLFVMHNDGITTDCCAKQEKGCCGCIMYVITWKIQETRQWADTLKCQNADKNGKFSYVV